MLQDVWKVCAQGVWELTGGLEAIIKPIPS